MRKSGHGNGNNVQLVFLGVEIYCLVLWCRSIYLAFSEMFNMVEIFKSFDEVFNRSHDRFGAYLDYVFGTRLYGLASLRTYSERDCLEWYSS